MSFPLLLLTIDFFGITVALPSIGARLGVDSAVLEWTINAYALAFAAPLVAVGRLGDIIGRRRVLLIGTLLFALASAGCGLAEEDWWLVTGRALQGLASAMIYATSLSIVSNAFPAEERGTGIGVWSAVGMTGSAIGPVVGGLLTQLLSWRWFFFVNLPIAAIGLALTLLVVEESRDESAGGRVDLGGFALVTAGFVLLVLGFQLANDLGLGSVVVIACMAGGLLLLVAFAGWERRVAEPLIAFELFAGRAYVAATAVAFLANYGFGVMTFFVTLYLQNVLLFSPDRTAIVFLALSVPFVLTSLGVGRAEKAWGTARAMAIGMALSGLANVVVMLVTPQAGALLVVLGLILFAIGQGLAYNISTTAGMSAVAEAKAGAASGVLCTVRLLGFVFGIAATGTLFQSLESARLTALLTEAGPTLTLAQRAEIHGLLAGAARARAALATIVPALADRMEAIVGDAFVHGLIGGLGLTLVLAVAGIGAALLVAPPPAALSPRPAAAA